MLKQLEAEGRQATDEEKAILVRYVGWGGMPQAFQDNKEKSWNDRAAELKGLLTKEEYNVFPAHAGVIPDTNSTKLAVSDRIGGEVVLSVPFKLY